jgi:hypothetical protein
MASLLLAVCILLSIAVGGRVDISRISYSQAEQTSAYPPGFRQVRYATEDDKLRLFLPGSIKPDAKREVDALGANTAGLLNGWSMSGKRSVFQLVTGISAGAHIAPFAFWGTTWDGALCQAYFGPKTAHLMQRRGVLHLLTTPGLNSKALLEELVRSYVSEQMIQAVAGE